MLYFAYGANLNLRGMKRRCPKAKPLSPATLTGYRLEFRIYATVVPDSNSKVLGALYDLTAACLRALDEYEGPEYDKIDVTVETPEGQQQATAYILKAGERAPPSVAYYGDIARGYTDWKLDTASLRKARLATLHPEKPKPVKPSRRAGGAGEL